MTQLLASFYICKGHFTLAPLSLRSASKTPTCCSRLWRSLMRWTTTKSGLVVTAKLIKGDFERGRKVSEQQMAELNIE